MPFTHRQSPHICPELSRKFCRDNDPHVSHKHIVKALRTTHVPASTNLCAGDFVLYCISYDFFCKKTNLFYIWVKHVAKSFIVDESFLLTKSLYAKFRLKNGDWKYLVHWLLLVSKVFNNCFSQLNSKLSYCEWEARTLRICLWGTCLISIT